jgi:hypothetical protein
MRCGSIQLPDRRGIVALLDKNLVFNTVLQQPDTFDTSRIHAPVIA